MLSQCEFLILTLRRHLEILVPYRIVEEQEVWLSYDIAYVKHHCHVLIGERRVLDLKTLLVLSLHFCATHMPKSI